jgi:3-deoxy-D-manno-octulosonic-acid transferase
MSNRVALRYRLLLALLSPFVLAHLFYYALRRNGGRRYIYERLGIYTQPCPANSIWLHAASVGEVNAAIPLLKLLFQHYPDRHWLLTTNTATGAQTVKQKLDKNVRHCYLPLDYRFSVQRFLRRHQPCCSLIMETELWPNLYHACKRQKIPLALINARLSKKSLHMPRFLYKVAKTCLAQVDIILARGQQDQKAFIQLGAGADKIRMIGNIKYAAHTAGRSIHRESRFDRPYILAASTHADEEAQLATMWKGLNISSHLLVIVPRYPDRRQAVLDDINRAGLNVAVHSRSEPVNKDTDVYLIDTLGELAGFMADAAIVFMGGSLVPRGGQNVLEPAAMGRTIITGLLSYTFAEDIEAMQASDAILLIKDIDELGKTITELLQNPDRARQIGDNASRFIEKRADVAERYLDAIKKLGWLEKK